MRLLSKIGRFLHPHTNCPVRKRCLKFEELEPRLTLAIDVAVYLVNGYGGAATPNDLPSDMDALFASALADGRIASYATFVTDWNSSNVRQRSSNPHSGTDDAFVAAMAEELTLYDPEDIVILIGHSFGGDSLLAAAERQQRSAAEIDLLAVLDPVAFAGVRGDYYGMGENVRYFYNRWQENAPFPNNFVDSGSISESGFRSIQDDFGFAAQAEQSDNKRADGSKVERTANSFDILWGSKLRYEAPSLEHPLGRVFSTALHHSNYPHDDLIESQLLSIVAGLVPQRPTIAVSVVPPDPKEGGLITLDATATVDPNPGETATLTYAWTQVAGPFGGTYAVTLSNPASSSPSFVFNDNTLLFQPLTFRLTVTDETGLQSTQDIQVQIGNVNPTVAPIVGPPVFVRGFSASFASSFTDPGLLDTHTADWAFGDGTFSGAVPTASNNFSTGHIYTASGTYTVAVTIRDDDGGVGVSPNRLIEIRAAALVPNPNNPSLLDLLVGGTLAGDSIELISVGSAGDIKVLLNGVDEGTFRPTGDIKVAGQAGGDRITLPLDIGRPAFIFGDGGEDRLLIDDTGFGSSAAYTVTPTFVERNPRVTFDSVEFVSLEAGAAPNVFNVTPSVTTEFFLDGNLPLPFAVPSALGDTLLLDTSATSGRKITFDPPKSGNGRWTFTSGHKDVVFESIERFNHVERMVVAGDAARDGKPTIKVYDAETKEFLFEFTPYDAAYRDGVRVATGDVDGDGIPDIVVAPGRTHEPLVKVYDGLGPEAIVPPAPVALVLPGDLDEDGAVDGADFLSWQRRVSTTTSAAAFGDWQDNFGATYDDAPAANGLAPLAANSDDYLLSEFLAYDPAFINGVALAVGDVTGDFWNDIVVAPSYGPAEVRVFENRDFGATFSLFDQFLAYPAGFIGGASVAIGDITGDGRGDIVTSTGAGSYVTVKVFDGQRLQTPQKAVPVSEFTAFDASVRGGAFVAIGNVVGDMRADIVLGGGPYANSRVQVFDGAALPPMGAAFAAPALEYQAYSAFADNPRAPVRVTVKDHDLDGVADAIINAQGSDGRSRWLREFDVALGALGNAFREEQAEFQNGFWLA